MSLLGKQIELELPDDNQDILREENFDFPFIESNFFDAKDVFHIANTEETTFVLLRNGRVLSWGERSYTLGRKCKSSVIDSFVPKEIEFKNRILDIVCGKNHCLARNVNGEVFSWGSNLYGQLGLVALKRKEYIERDEPCKIQYFQGIRIKQIFAKNNSSFAISEEANNIYGWGSNARCLISQVQCDYVGLPTLITIDFGIMNEIYFAIDNEGRYADLIELKMPNSDISKSLAYYENAISEQKIIDLRKEVIKLEELVEISKVRKLRDIRNRLQELKIYFDKSCRELEKNDFKLQKEKYRQIDKSYEELLKYQNDKEKSETNKPKKNSNNKDDKPVINKDPQKTEDIKMNIQSILQYLNETLHNNKNLTFKESQELMSLIVQNEKEYKKFNDYKLICEDIRKKAELLGNMKPVETVIKDMRDIDNEISNIIRITEDNCIRKCSLDNTRSSLKSKLSQAFENASNLIRDLQNLRFDASAESAQESKKILKANLIYCKQNNILLDKILNLSNSMYTKNALKDLITIKPEDGVAEKIQEEREQHWKMSLHENKRREQEEEEEEIKEENIRSQNEGYRFKISNKNSSNFNK